MIVFVMVKPVYFPMHNNNVSLKTNYTYGCRCTECCEHNSQYQKEWRTKGKYKARKDRRREAIEQAKNVPCADCGNRYPTVCMDFDHTEDNKEFDIAGTSRSLENVLTEIAKCEVVCSNCHRIRTAQRGQYVKNVRTVYGEGL